uniref:Uncharacterized protein n=1 Tax=Acrobeloides nanus TaxID=290746 RepID=A0A914EHH0_9BILA
PFLQQVNSKSLHLREAANACHIFSHDIYNKGCTPNPNVLNVVIDFSRTLHQEFRTKLNLCELIMELPIRFPKLESFKFIAEQDALLEDHYNRMICLREFGQSIYNIEEIMEGFEPCPFEFIVDIFCFVPRAALQFMITQVFFGYHEAELLPEDKTRFAFKRLEKYFGQENPRCLIIRLC